MRQILLAPPLALAATLACADRAAWPVTPDGVGPIQFGMTPAEAASAAKVATPGFSDSSCDYWHPEAAPAGLSFMVENGHVVRADLDSATVPGPRGLRVGSPVSAVEVVYGSALRTEPHKYRWEEGWRYLIVLAPDSSRGLIFEVDSHVVRQVRAGLWPEVAYVERCS